MSIYQHFENTENKVFVIRHSRISPGDSCLSQLLSIIRDIKFFDPLLANVHILCSLKTRGIKWEYWPERGWLEPSIKGVSRCFKIFCKSLARWFTFHSSIWHKWSSILSSGGLSLLPETSSSSRWAMFFLKKCITCLSSILSAATSVIFEI